MMLLSKNTINDAKDFYFSNSYITLQNEESPTIDCVLCIFW